MPVTLDAVSAGLLAGVAVAILLPPDPAERLSRALGPPVRGASQVWWARRSGRPPGGPEPGSGGSVGVRRAAERRPGGGTPVPVVTDLVAAALLTGLPPVVAIDAVADALDAAGDRTGPALRAGDERFAALTEALGIATASGLGPVPLVQAAASQARRTRAARSQVAARRLGTLVVLPTGLCLLPAFVLFTVAPLVLDLLLG